MLRKVLPLMFLLIFASSDYAFGWRHRCCRRARCCCAIQTDRVPMHCLQVKIMDFAGNYDLYDCLTYDDGCPPDPSDPDSPYEDMYLGPKDWDLVQACPNCELDDIQLRGDKRFVRKGGGKGPTGHGKNFRDKDAACDFLTSHGGAAGNQDCKYYEIEANTCGRHQKYCFVAVTITLPNGATHYVGVQTKDLDDTPETASYANCDILHEDGNAKVLKFDITIEGGTNKGLVWLK